MRPSAPVLLAVVAAIGFSATTLTAQGVTTTAIRGRVAMADGSPADGSLVDVRSGATGFVVRAEVRRGRFGVEGLEGGGPYRITVRRIGAATWELDQVYLTLGEPLELEVTLEPRAVELDSIVVAAAPVSNPLSNAGTGTTLTDSLVHRLPSLNRDVYDFLRLVPQISTRIGFPAGGISGGGVGFRLNHFLINGVSERSLAGGQPPEFAGGKSLPFEAVREYQVLVAPFDVRYGDFAGAMVNTITRSGSNRLQGSVFGAGRSEDLGGGPAAALPYQRWQYGGSLSGPIVRNRAQFFLAAEGQNLRSPMAGPWVGQPATAPVPVPVSSSDLALVADALRGYGLDAGSGGAVPNRDDVGNLFARVDAALPAWRSRVVAWVNGSDARNTTFSRPAPGDTFALTSNAATTSFDTRTAALQLFSDLPSGSNELSLSRRSIRFAPVPEARQPLVSVLAPTTSGGTTVLVTGAPAQAQGGRSEAWNVDLHDHLIWLLGASHEVSAGVEVEWFRVALLGVRNAFGTWTFSSLDSLEAGDADRYELNQDFGAASTPLSGRQFGLYAGDYWRVSSRLSLTFGLRADLLATDQRPPYSPLVDSLFGRRTDTRFPRTAVFSPRFGLTWNPLRGRRDQLRAGLGLFAGRPPLAWLHAPLQNYGEGIGTLRCGSLPGDIGLPPVFNPDPDQPPLTCAGGGGLDRPPPGDVELLAPGLTLARTLRAVLAYERPLPAGLTGTVEALLTRNLSDYAFVNLNLAGPVGADPRGRVLYGSLDSLGRAHPVRVTDRLPSVIELRNVSQNHAAQVAVSLTRPFAGGFSVMAGYSWSRVRDVQTPLRVNARGILNWASLALSGSHSAPGAGISLNDVPHRVTLAGTWRAPWKRWTTELALLYVGESGSPFTYLTGGAGGRGDLNADGALNDPVYVPRSAFDLGEIRFSGLSPQPGADNSPAAQSARILAQQTALERFIEASPCLRTQRGGILVRNSCREPWSHTTVASVRQAIPVGGAGLELQFDVYNLLNLLDGDWGLRRVTASATLLEQVGQVTGSSGQPEPAFRFPVSTTPWRLDPTESGFQLQFGARYRF